MTKRLVAKVGEYQKDGQTKGEYVKIGVIMSNQNGEYVLIDPSVSLSGVLAKQNVMSFAASGKLNNNVMCSIFDDSAQQQRPQQSQQPQHRPQQQPQQNQRQPNPQAQKEPDFDFDDNLPPF